jgi:metal-responsive CopG/Arc/MetJ family transcriptional regulator
MKTAISVPDETFAQVETCAADLGISRSEFFTRAARQYLERLEADSLTARINAALDVVWPGGVTIDEATSDAMAHARRRLAANDEQW